MNKTSAASLLLRIGLTVVFLYAAIAAFLNPTAWTGYLPAPLTAIIPADLLLKIFSIVEIILSLWLLSGKKTFYAAAFATLMLVGIIASNLTLLDIIFRDFAILFAALALAALSYDR